MESIRETMERVAAAEKPEAIEKPVAEKPVEKPVEAEKPAEKPEEAEIPAKPTGEDDTEVAPSPINPPKSWPKEAREGIWNTLTPEAQALVHKREMEIANAARRYGNELKQVKEQYGEIGRFMETHQSRWAKNGYLPSQAIAQLVALDELAERDPVQFIQLAAQKAGIDLKQLTHGGVQAPPQPQQPDVATLVRQQVEQERLNSVIDGFLSDKSNFPHAEQVFEDMAPFVAAIRNKDPQMPHSEVLKKAYEKAVMANPDLAETLEAERRAKELQAQQERALKAQRASGSIKPQGAAPAPAGPRPGESVAETLRRQFANQGRSL